MSHGTSSSSSSHEVRDVSYDFSWGAPDLREDPHIRMHGARLPSWHRAQRIIHHLTDTATHMHTLAHHCTTYFLELAGDRCTTLTTERDALCSRLDSCSDLEEPHEVVQPSYDDLQ